MAFAPSFAVLVPVVRNARAGNGRLAFVIGRSKRSGAELVTARFAMTAHISPRRRKTFARITRRNGNAVPSPEWKLAPPPKWDNDRKRFERAWLKAWEQRNDICAAVASFRFDATADGWECARLHGPTVGEPLHRAFTLRRAGLLIIGICRQGPPDYRQLPVGAITLFRGGEGEVLPCGLVYDWEHIRQFAAKGA